MPPYGYYSSVVDAIEQLSDSRELPCNFWVELLLVVMRHNSSSFLRNIIRRWLPSGDPAFGRFEENLRNGHGPGINVNQGLVPRYQWSMNSDGAKTWPDDRRSGDRLKIKADVKKLDRIIRKAERGCFHEKIIEQLLEIDHIGPVKALCFDNYAVMLGMLTSPDALCESK